MDSVCGYLRPSKEEAFLRQLEAMRGENDIFLLGGIRFKYAPVWSKRTLDEDLKLGMERCDAVVVTGFHVNPEKVKTYRTILGDFPLIVGDDITAETAQEHLPFSDGAIVGSFFKEDGHALNPVDEERVKEFVCKARISNGV